MTFNPVGVCRIMNEEGVKYIVLGVTVCRILEVRDLTVRVAGLDAIDGTPVVDIKPWMVECGPRGNVLQPAWSTELMKHYW